VVGIRSRSRVVVAAVGVSLLSVTAADCSSTPSMVSRFDVSTLDDLEEGHASPESEGSMSAA
jgi:hypothetical protein